MRHGLTRKKHRRALFALVVMLLGCSALADELSNDPQAKIRPPGGIQASQPEPQAKIGPPGGVQASEPAPDGVAARALFDAFRIWLSLQRTLSPFG